MDAAEEDKYASLLTFRDQTYTSVYSGAMSQPVHREWVGRAPSIHRRLPEP